jgi:hypothetical protein
MYTVMPFRCTSSTRKDGKGRPVKIITDNSVETIVFGNNDVNNDSLDAVYIQVGSSSPKGW